MRREPETVVVRAPATSANLGAGFDCLGMALDLWNEVQGVPGGLESQGDNLILRAARAVFEQTGRPYPGFEIRCTNRIPFGRGLGSSAAAIACGVLLANHCLGSPLDDQALLQLATRLEGHPDNVTPCLLGGVRVAALMDSTRIVQARVPVAMRLQAVCFVPDQSTSTVHARGVLPTSVPLADALFNVARASLLVAALASGRTDVLAEATRDRLHQPYRLPLFPAGATLLDTAMHAGALAAFVSGAGPSVLALCGEDRLAAAVGEALASTAQRVAVSGRCVRLALTDAGAHVVS